ncbi:MAG: Aspartate--tRNA(Asp/Asn) ligase [Firmicutes bacterium]|nr:Aspartate--tRNA(Asp/Asn) ligase [Bacillota bacterium]
MSNRVLVADLSRHQGEMVTVKGWVRRTRAVSAELAFLVVADRSGEAQLVLSGSSATTLPSLESVVEVYGLAVTSRSRAFPVEVQVESMVLLAPSESLPFPINKPELEVGLELIDRFRPLCLRHPRFQRVFRVEQQIILHFEQFFAGQGFLRVSTPKLVATGTEGGAELFSVNYFGDVAYLAQSPQFFKQMLVGSGFERVFEVGSVFRAEQHKTSRHLNEFISLDIEIGFVEDVNTLMDMEEEFIKSLLPSLHQEFGEAIKCPSEIPPIPRLALEEAQSILEKEYGRTPSSDGNIDPEGERLISQWAEREYGVAAVFLHSYPRPIRPFYALPGYANNTLTESFDLIFRGQEITTGGLRQHSLPPLLQSMKERGLNPEKYEFYLQVFRYGMCSGPQCQDTIFKV